MSGIYIHGMSMPTEAGVIVIYKRSGKFYAGNGMCPIEPVPDHGRLVDADELVESEPRYTIPYYNSDGYLADMDGAYTVDQILDAPTVIESDYAPAPDEPRPIDGHRKIHGTLNVQTGVLTIVPADAVRKE